MIRFVKHMNIAMRDVPPCVIPETKHWRNTPPQSQQCVRPIQQYGRQEKALSILLLTFSRTQRTTSFGRSQKENFKTF